MTNPHTKRYLIRGFLTEFSRHPLEVVILVTHTPGISEEEKVEEILGASKDFQKQWNFHHIEYENWK